VITVNYGSNIDATVDIAGSPTVGRRNAVTAWPAQQRIARSTAQNVGRTYTTKLPPLSVMDVVPAEKRRL